MRQIRHTRLNPHKIRPCSQNNVCDIITNLCHIFVMCDMKKKMKLGPNVVKWIH